MDDQVKPKTNGDVLRECVRRVVGDRNAREVFADDDERETAFDAIAAEYDKAWAQLPEDIEAFVSRAEALLSHDGFWHAVDAGEGIERPDVGKLLAIIRAQGAELAKNRTERRKDLSEMAQLADALDGVRAAIGQKSLPDVVVSGAVTAIVAERDALRNRLDKCTRDVCKALDERDKLAKAAKYATDHLEGCTISHPDGATLAMYMLGELREMVKGAESGTTQTK